MRIRDGFKLGIGLFLAQLTIAAVGLLTLAVIGVAGVSITQTILPYLLGN